MYHNSEGKDVIPAIQSLAGGREGSGHKHLFEKLGMVS